MAALFLLFCHAAYTQPTIEWQANFAAKGEEFEPHILRATSDGGYLLGNSRLDVTDNNTGWDYCIVKVNASGIKEWEQVLGGDEDDFLRSLHLTSDGGCIVGGDSRSGVSGNKTTPNFGSKDYWIAKVDASGNKEWDRTFGGSAAEKLVSAQQVADGGYILAGESVSGTSGNKTNAGFGETDYWLVKVDATGNKEWERVFGGNDKDKLVSVIPTIDRGFLLGGETFSDISGNKTSPHFGLEDYWVVKVDENGSKLWEATYGGTNYEWLTIARPTADGGCILAGFSASHESGNKTSPNFGFEDWWVVKTDSNGVKEWEQTFGGRRSEWVSCIQSTSDGGYIIGGGSESDVSGNKTTPHFGEGDYWLVKVDGNGSNQWERVFGGDDWDGLSDVQSTSDGGYIVAGRSASDISGNKTSGGFGSIDYWILKLDASGNKQWEQTFGGDDEDTMESLQPAQDGGFLLCGTSESDVSGNKTTTNYTSADWWLVKIEPALFQLEASPPTNGVFTLRVSGLTGYGNVTISASTNLADWTPIFTNPPVAGAIEIEESSTTSPHRFYRAIEMP